MRKIRILPNKKQRNWLIKTSHRLRALRNEMIASVNDGKVKTTLKELKRNFVSTIATGLDHNESKRDDINEVPFNIRGEVVRGLVSNYSTLKKQTKQNKISHFRMRFGSRKKKRGRITIPLSCHCISKKPIKNDKLVIMPSLKLGGIKMRRTGSRKGRKPYPDLKKYGLKIVYEEPNRWFIIVPYKPIDTLPQTKYKDVSLDPGVRDFQTFYSVDASMVGHINVRCKDKLKKLSDRIKNMRSLRQKQLNAGKKANKYRDKELLSWLKLKNITKELHWKTIRFLIINFKHINIGKFDGNFVMVGKNKTLKKELSILSQFSFREKLLNKTTERTISVVNEHFTSKTCSRCGWMNENLGRNKTFNCKDCGAIMDRDINAARNIGYKALIM